MDLPAPPPIPTPTEVEGAGSLRRGLAPHPPAAQLTWMQRLRGRQLKRLWDLAEADPLPLEVGDFAPDSGEVRILPGKNHLPFFNHFEKRFAKVGDEIVGYNETGWERLWVGDGHFVVRPSPERPDEVWIDYRTPPAGQHPDFPPVRDNRRIAWPGPLSRLVYGGLVDRMIRVDDHLLIGRSMTTGLSLQAGAFFALWLPPGPKPELPG